MILVKMKLFLLLVAICIGCEAAVYFNYYNLPWEAYKITFEKTYNSQSEELYRRKIFMETAELVKKHNLAYDEGLVSFKLELNAFADMDLLEFESTSMGFISESVGDGLFGQTQNDTFDDITFMEPANAILAENVDWRKNGAVTPVKNQKQCRSCWSFSATGALEGQHFRKTHKLISLSEQNLIDCSTRFGNHGCNGGRPDTSFKYVKANHGLDTETSYPYEAEDDKCRYNPSNSGATDSGFVHIESGNEAKLKAAVATIGPISVAIDATHESFKQYSHDIYYEPKCSSQRLTHAVLVVGYGTEGGVDYWLVKNSWGPNWGINGYVKMARNKHNNCGIASQATYPLV